MAPAGHAAATHGPGGPRTHLRHVAVDVVETEGIGAEGPDRRRAIETVSPLDGDVTRYPVRYLRTTCKCAVCVDERTGKRILDVRAIPDDIQITDMSLAGNYAVKFTFSDGHDTGIYSWKHLQAIQPKE